MAEMNFGNDEFSPKREEELLEEEGFSALGDENAQADGADSEPEGEPLRTEPAADGATESATEDVAGEGNPVEKRREENPYANDGIYRGNVVTEAVVYERKLPHSSERSATFETVEDISSEGVTDSDYLAGMKPVIYYHLSDYDGPLDLLLELIRAAKIQIEDIFISDVTRQYVEIIKSIPQEEMDYEYAGEFIMLAAELVYLKSLRSLPSDDEDYDEFDEGEIQRRDFIKKIQAFALMKQQSEKLREVETINRFYRMPVFTEKDYRVVLTNFSLPKLVEAFARVMVNAERRETSVIPKKVVQDRFSVADQMRHILELTSFEKSFPFTSLFEPDFDRSDIVTTFLAVLELLKYGKLRAEQEEVFGEIMLFAVDGASDTPFTFEEEEDGKY